jgi:hypothetical protein
MEPEILLPYLQANFPYPKTEEFPPPIRKIRFFLNCDIKVISDKSLRQSCSYAYNQTLYRSCFLTASVS